MARPKKIKPEQPASGPAVPVEEVRTDDNTKGYGSTVTFVGDPRGGVDPEVAEYGRMSFPKDKAVPVSADWLNANGNIRKNNHFKVV